MGTRVHRAITRAQFVAARKSWLQRRSTSVRFPMEEARQSARARVRISHTDPGRSARTNAKVRARHDTGKHFLGSHRGRLKPMLLELAPNLRQLGQNYATKWKRCHFRRTCRFHERRFDAIVQKKMKFKCAVGGTSKSSAAVSAGSRQWLMSDAGLGLPGSANGHLGCSRLSCRAVQR